MKVLQIHVEDNVAVALDAIQAGTEARVLGAQEEASVKVRQEIPFAHKVALRPIAKGESIVKYGAPVGIATANIATGDWVHTHNVQSAVAVRHGEQTS